MLTIFCLLTAFNTEFVCVAPKTSVPNLNTRKVWVFFTDKGVFNENQYQTALNALRQKTTPLAQLDFYDLPVRTSYIRQIEALGARMRCVSNWLNAASFDMPPELASQIYQLPFVYDIRPVGIRTEIDREITFPIPQPLPPMRKVDTAEAHRFYGASYDQAQMLGVPEIFYRGYLGSGVKLALFDTGIKLKHTAVKGIRIARQYDFISGDNFYHQRGMHSEPAPIPSLRYLGLVKDPALVNTQNTLMLTFVADSFNYPYGLPARALFLSSSTDQGETWSEPVALAISRPYYYTYENLQMISRDSVTYLAFNELNLNPGGQPICYLGYFTNTTWRNRLTVGNGKKPSLTIFEDTLYFVYITSDSSITFKKYSITQPAPTLLLTTTVNYQEPISELLITAGPAGVINLIALCRTSGKIAQLRSTDGGNTFNTTGTIVSQSARMIKLYPHSTTTATKLLLYLDDNQPPFTRLNAKLSNDYGTTWDIGSVVDSALNIGDFTALIGDEIKLVYESNGVLYRCASADYGTTWQTAVPIDTIGFSVAPRLVAIDGNDLLLWLRRGDENAVWEDADTLKFSREQPNHGTRMASIIAGYQPYSLMGIAPAVDLFVARTEFHKTASNRYYEYNMEEDTYIQALEWAARTGADIVSTSLGYRDFYRDEQFDGKTIPVSIASDLATKKGLLVVTAMGNRDSTTHPWPQPYIVAPGDAEGVITCGGVQKNMLPWRGTGIGPTADGRIKPDLVALADTVAVAAPDSENLLEGSAGTSCATALIAGCAALLKEAHPSWTVDSIKTALFMTASLAVKSCTFGFGVPRVDSAFKIFPPVPQATPVARNEIGKIFPNPFKTPGNDRIFFGLNIARVTPDASITIYTINGTPVITLPINTRKLSSPGRYYDIPLLEEINACWDGKNEAGKPVASGLYIAVLKTTFGRSASKFALIRKP
ncbi:MAG: S8 family serine peptidase [candidate division WOR-3 bacterium]|jgi:subtilisin family serine protease|nr:S8 family serine peptidase [candidate division WOR-3 bacterium]MCR4423394.1 S8 family serine peptidase [candidate division WOR-3 bacterium]MDH7518733.1 S8 family serine peptidase [bacterium]